MPLHTIFRGRVWHARREPFQHRFDYGLALLGLDLDHLDSAFPAHPLWALNRSGVASFHESDHLGGGSGLALRARAAVADRLGFSPSGRVQLICQPRYFGYTFNPVTFYLFHSGDAGAEGEGMLEAILLEVTNTPWNERHAYALDCRDAVGPWHFELDKAFHVSPFLPMDLRYAFDVRLQGDRFEVTKRTLSAGRVVFVARMVLEALPLDRRGLGALLAAFPSRTLRVVAAIYWQALRLWLRGASYHPHPVNAARSRAGH